MHNLRKSGGIDLYLYLLIYLEFNSYLSDIDFVVKTLSTGRNIYLPDMKASVERNDCILSIFLILSFPSLLSA